MVKIMQNGPELQKLANTIQDAANEFDNNVSQMYELIHQHIVMEDNESATWFGTLARQTRQTIDGQEPDLRSITTAINADAEELLGHATTWGGQL